MKPTITTDLIRDTLTRYGQQGGALRIDGYRSQDGQVSNMLVQQMEADGYDYLVRASLEELRTLSKDAPDLRRMCQIPEDVDASGFWQCVSEQLSSWEKRASTPEGEGSNRRLDAGLLLQPAGYYLSMKDPDTTILLHLDLLSQEIESGQVSGETAWNKTRIKNAIKAVLPLHRYVGRLNLSPGNIRGLQIVPL